MCFACFRFYLLYSKLDSVGYCLWGKQHDNLETAFCTTWHLYNTKTSVFRFNLRTAQRIRKELDESNGDYPAHIMVMSNDNIIHPFIISHGLRLNMEAYIKCLKELVCIFLDQEGGLGQATGLCHATQVGES